MKFKILFLLAIFIFSLSIPPAFSAGITIGNGATLTLNNALISMGCSDINIEDGGTLDMGNGTIAQVKHLLINNGGVYIPAIGNISYCRIPLPGVLPLLLLY